MLHLTNFKEVGKSGSNDRTFGQISKKPTPKTPRIQAQFDDFTLDPIPMGKTKFEIRNEKSVETIQIFLPPDEHSLFILINHTSRIFRIFDEAEIFKF